MSKGIPRKHRFFTSAKGDSPAKKLLIHLLLITASVIALYPFLRVVTISLRPGSQLLSTDLSLIPKDATLDNYRTLILEKDFVIWLWNSLVVSLTTVIV
ncbi:MAG TPA: hypothetical protein GX529_10310, partial [Firmicutes bacterium]|nr:hypothetical protein [Candidatus Fermentithermobacillaceae bacterium]